MAESSEGTSKKLDLIELVDDFKLLFPSGGEKISTMKKGKRILEERIKELEETNGTLNEGYQRILEDLKQTRDRMHILKKYFTEVKDAMKENLLISQREQDDFLAKGEEYIADLENGRCIVFIAGETSAGKSSLINLLLSDHVLPTCILQNTYTICEISYGPRKEAVIHFSKEDSLELEESEFDKIKKLIEQPLPDSEDDNRCERIEIKIPNPLLKGGMVIVDSPGIGDSEQVNKVALEYLPQAYAIIYVINSSHAGGIQEDRLLRILGEWKQLYTGFDITTKCALFVCNKWDEVDNQANDAEKEALKKDTIAKLKEKIPELDEESQVIKMSVLTANKVLEKFKVMNDDLKGLINGLQRLLRLYIESKADKFYWYISGALYNLLGKVKSEIKKAKQSREERSKPRKELEEKLIKLKQRIPTQEIEHALSDHIHHLCQKVASHLQSDEVRRGLLTWSEKDLPPIDDRHKTNITKIKEIYSRCIEERFESCLRNWENKEKLFAKAREDLEGRFHQVVVDFEKNIHDVDRVFIAGKSGEDAMMPEMSPQILASDPRMKKFLVVTLGVFMPVLFPVGLAAGVLSAPVFAYLAIGKHLKERLLIDNSIKALEELSKEFLDDFNVSSYVNNNFSEEIQRIDKIKKIHQQLIPEYEQRCQDLTKSEDEARVKETAEKNRTFHEKLQAINQNLIFDAIQNGVQVMSCRIDDGRLHYNEKKELARGSYGQVFKGKLSYSENGRKKMVAVKKILEASHPSDVATFLQEADMLKALEHKHIVLFYGVVMKVHNYKLLSLELVFKLCTGSLKNHIFENDNCIPWKTASAIADTLKWTKQILDALEFMHSVEAVHRDLKLENILITKKGDIKVSDLGLTSYKTRITGTFCGTISYMAPEVYEGKPYGTEVDMYSFGLMMWEMWFGKRAFSELNVESPREFFQRIMEENYRPKTPRSNPPPARWTELMESCWQTEPSLRRTATQCKDLMKELEVYTAF